MKNPNITRLFGNKSNSASKAQQKRKFRRTCRIEELENREMLDADLFGAIKDAYTDLDLGDDWERYNFIEIHAQQLSERFSYHRLKPEVLHANL